MSLQEVADRSREKFEEIISKDPNAVFIISFKGMGIDCSAINVEDDHLVAITALMHEVYRKRMGHEMEFHD